MQVINIFKILAPGHRYWLPNLEAPGGQELTFIKRTSKMIDYGKEEHPGTNTQNVIRALIERTQYLNSVGACTETQDAIYYLRMALYSYELRAWRRKRDKLNKEAGAHADGIDDRSPQDSEEIPFTEQDIENLPVGEDGHIIPTGIKTSTLSWGDCR